MCNLNVLIVILSIVVYTKCVGELEDGFERKRYDISLQMCIDNFDIHADKIIRTQDSRAMGAKYLNEAEVNGRDECLKLCCETLTCDVFVYEQKIPGSCYLFHCGTPEDFKCKFTQHKNYTSAVLTLNNHLSELEKQIKLTKHEEELNRLRKPDTLLDTTIPPMLTTTKVPAIPETKTNHSLRNQCSRYQFECKSSGECIAIYNACDGIPQCSDGSDEAPELDCPGIAGTTRPKPLNEQSKMSTIQNTPQHANVPDPVSPEPHQPLNSKLPPYRPPPAPVWQQSPSSLGYFPYGQSSPNEKIPEFPAHQKAELQQQQQQQLANQAKLYGREGEGLSQQYPLGGMQWQGYQSQHPEEGSHIFTHKGSGLVPESSDSQIPGPYNNELSHSEYLKYAAAAAANGNNGYYNGGGPVYYNPGPNNWLPRQMHPPGLEDAQQRPNLGMYAAGNAGPGLSDYYYEDSQLRGRLPIQQDPRSFENNEGAAFGQKQALEKEAAKQENLKQQLPAKAEEEKPKKTESVKKTLPNPASAKHKDSEEKTKIEVTTTPTKLEKHNHVAEKLSMNEDDVVLKDLDAENDRPSGAILSLTLGMCITAIMITLVGCRLRVVRRRMRRNGKSPYAHDPDFLVNGMYL